MSFFMLGPYPIGESAPERSSRAFNIGEYRNVAQRCDRLGLYWRADGASTGGCRPGKICSIKEWVKELAHTQGKTIVLTTHQLDMAEELKTIHF